MQALEGEIKANIAPPIINCRIKIGGGHLVGHLQLVDVEYVLLVKVTNPVDQEGLLINQRCPVTGKPRDLVIQLSFAKRHEKPKKLIALCMDGSCGDCLGVPNTSPIPGTIYR